MTVQIRVPVTLVGGSILAHVEAQKLKRRKEFQPRVVLSLAGYLTSDVAPPGSEWSAAMKQLPYDLNAQLGCCVEEYAAYQVACWSSNTGGPETLMTKAEIEQDYEILGGYIPGYPRSDRGTDPVRLFARWQSRGLGVPGGKFDKIAGSAIIEPADVAVLAAAMHTFGGSSLSLNLPKTAIKQTFVEPWDVVDPSLKGDAAPGSWGGHQLLLADFDGSATFGGVTWGGVQPMTARFLEAYAPQAWAVVSNDWIATSGTSPSGIDLAGLLSDLHALQPAQPATA